MPNYRYGLTPDLYDPYMPRTRSMPMPPLTSLSATAPLPRVGAATGATAATMAPQPPGVAALHAAGAAAGLPSWRLPSAPAVPHPTQQRAYPPAPAWIRRREEEQTAEQALLTSQQRSATPEAALASITPQAMGLLTPQTAAALQAQSELEARRLNEQFAQQAGAMLATPTEGQEMPGYPSEYWASVKRSQEGDIRARYRGLEQQIREQARGGASPMYVQRKLAELQEAMNADILKANAAVDRQIVEQSEEARLQRARTYLGLAEARPYEGAAWTQVENYLQGSQYAQELMNMYRDLMSRAGTPTQVQMPAIRGGGGGRGGGGAPQGDWWPGLTTTPNRMFAGGGGAGGGAGTATGSIPYIRYPTISPTATTAALTGGPTGFSPTTVSPEWSGAPAPGSEEAWLRALMGVTSWPTAEPEAPAEPWWGSYD